MECCTSRGTQVRAARWGAAIQPSVGNQQCACGDLRVSSGLALELSDTKGAVAAHNLQVSGWKSAESMSGSRSCRSPTPESALP